MTWPKIDTLFMTAVVGTDTLNISYEGFLVTVFLIIMKKVAPSKKHTQYFQTRVLKPYPIDYQSG